MIIDALYTIKSAKLVGENLWEGYYLMDLYESKGAELTPAVHAVLWSEMLNRSSGEGIDVLSALTNVVAVYEDTATLVDTVIDYYSGGVPAKITVTDTVIDTNVLGFFAEWNPKATYKKVALTSLPAAFAKLPNEKPNYLRPVYQSTTISTDWLNNIPITGANPAHTYSSIDQAEALWRREIPQKQIYILYKEPSLTLYSRNGVEILLTKEERFDLLELQNYINYLLKEYEDPSREFGFFESDKKKENEMVARLEATERTRKWIEDGVKMYVSSDDHISLTAKLRLAWRQMYP